MPLAHESWTQASAEASTLFKIERKQPRQGVPRGYVFPDPSVIANHQDKGAR
jgi:hypothetical protein